MADDAKILAGNLEALSRFPVALAAVQAVDPNPDECLSEARNGDPIIQLPGDDGVERFLHSRYRPRDEARSQLPEGPSPIGTLIFLGAGLGYSLIDLQPRLTDENHVFWVEPDARLFRTAMGLFDFRELFARPLFAPIVGAEPGALYKLMMSNVARLLAGSIQLVPHPPSLQARPSLYGKLSEAVHDFHVHGSVQMRTTMILSRRVTRNRAESVGKFITSPGIVSLQGALKGKPLLIVCAGPSLRRNLDDIQEAVGKIAILGVSTALRLLLGRGIIPDVTNVIDYDRISIRGFEGIGAEDAPPLVVTLGAASEVVEAYPGTQLFGDDYLFTNIFEGVGAPLGALPQTSSVGSNAFEIARFLEADPIIFAGLDLAFTGGLLHVPGTAVHNPVFPMVHRFFTLESRELDYYARVRDRMIKVPAVPEGEVPTDDIFFSYLKELGTAFGGYSGKIIDATEGGARVENCEVTTLRDAIARYRDVGKPDLRAAIREAAESVPIQEVRERGLERIDQLDEELVRVRAVQEELVPLLDEVVDATESGDIADSLARKIQKLGKEMDENVKIVELLKALSRSEMWITRLRADRILDASDHEGGHLQHHQAQRDRDLLVALTSAAPLAGELLRAMRISVEAIPAPATTPGD